MDLQSIPSLSLGFHQVALNLGEIAPFNIIARYSCQNMYEDKGKKKENFIGDLDLGNL